MSESQNARNVAFVTTNRGRFGHDGCDVLATSEPLTRTRQCRDPSQGKGGLEQEGEAAVVTATQKGLLRKTWPESHQESQRTDRSRTPCETVRTNVINRVTGDRAAPAVSWNQRPPMAWWEEGPWMRPRLQSGEEAEPRG